MKKEVKQNRGNFGGIFLSHHYLERDINSLMAKGYSPKKLGAALACAGLCLAISGFVAGCGDGGSTGSATLDYGKQGTVTFDLTGVASELGSVKYSFLNESGLPILVTDKLEIGQAPIAVAKVPKEAVKVIGYYFSGNQATDFSINTIDWNTDSGLKATVASTPTIADEDLEYYRVDPTYSHVDKGESTYVNLTASYLLPDSTYANLDLTPLANVKPIGHLVMQEKSSLLNNLYQGTAYGTQEFEVTSDSLANYTTNRVDDHHDYVYVSDAVLTGLILQDATTQKTKKVTVFNPNVDMGVDSTVVDGETCVVGEGAFVVYGVYTSPTTKSNDFQVQMRDREITWETPNSEAVNFQLGKDKATYTTKAAAENIPLSAYTYDEDNQKVSASIAMDIKDTEAKLYYEVANLVIGEEDYAAKKWLPIGDYSINFSLYAAYMIDGKQSDGSPVFGTTKAGEIVPVPASDKPLVEVDETSKVYKLSCGTHAANDKGSLRFKIVDAEDAEREIISTEAYDYTVKAVAP